MELILSLAAGLGTVAGAVGPAFFGQLKPKTFSLLLGVAAGVMAAVVTLDLLPASLGYGLISTLGGLAAGIGLLGLTEVLLSHLDVAAAETAVFLRMGYLIAAGIALHDLPEGLAIAAGFATGTIGPFLALAIGLHNIPEGLAIAAPLRYGGMSSGRVIGLCVLISFVTPLGTFLGLTAIRSHAALIGPLLALAAGAMTYIVVGELLPKSRQLGAKSAYLGLVAGFGFISGVSLLAH